ncbi:MAG: hypothetical protein HOJ16_06275 [Candidatus Peribacter sp.]|jgi:co-chaperonin GroES (HSP10)|nr:hypothetical protein [Candidatus Peribacter sp.]
MSSLPPRLKPTNRHLTIVPHFTERETESGVLLPDDYRPEEGRYIEATVIDVSEDCSKQFEGLRHGTVRQKKIVVDGSMVQEIKIGDRRTYIVLENHVVGIYRGLDEN